MMTSIGHRQKERHVEPNKASQSHRWWAIAVILLLGVFAACNSNQSSSNTSNEDVLLRQKRHSVSTEHKEHDSDRADPDLAQSSTVAETPFIRASLIQILAHPERYHEKRVSIEGYLILEFEGDAIYLCKDHADYGMNDYSLGVSVDDFSVVNQSQSEHYVTLVGTFDKDSKGHLGTRQAGCIENITQVIVREHRNVFHWFQLVQNQVESGETIEVFCRKKNIQLPEFIKWQKKFEEEGRICRPAPRNNADSGSSEGSKDESEFPDEELSPFE